jgi:drug/metabolite transporter (DMT)-like permease
MPITNKSIGAIIFTVIIWASAFPGIRAGLEGYSPGALALLRYLFASLTLASCTVLWPIRLPRRADLPGLVALGGLGIAIYHVALNYGEQTVTAGAASFLIATSPIFATLLAYWFLNERLTGWGWVGIGISMVGIGFIAYGEASDVTFDPGAVLVLTASLSGAGYFTLQKFYLDRYSPFALTAYAVWAGTLLMIFFLPGLVEQVPEASWNASLAVAYIGVFPGALAYVTYAYVLSQMPVAVTTSFLYMIPVTAIPISWIWLGEIPTLLSIGGGLVALLGVIVVQKVGKVKQIGSRLNVDT